MPSSTPTPKDFLGNELHEGDLVNMMLVQPLVMRVMKVDNGGLHIPQGVTPGVVMIGVSLTIRVPPGGLLPNLTKVVSPENDALVRKLLEAQA